jgi:hypothetical protein
MLKLTLTAALLASASCAANRMPAPTAASHPPAIDLTCQAEPLALSDDQVIADADGSAEHAFDDAVLLAGRSCRDALRRVCEWHKARGDKDLKCDTAAMSVRELERLRDRLS